MKEKKCNKGKETNKTDMNKERDSFADPLLTFLPKSIL
jgi:hypothetical protein